MILNPIDQRIRDQGFNFVPFNQYLASPFQIPNTENTADARVSAGLPTVYQPQGGGGGGGTYTGGINDLIENYTLDTRDQYFGSQKTPLVDDLYQSKLDKTFMGFPSFREQQLTGADLGEYIGSGTDVPLELTTAGRIQQGLGNVKEGIGGIVDKIGGFGPLSFVLNKMDRFNTLSPADQEFIKQNMGYTGPTVFGENTTGLSKDPFGLATRSMFGNYAERVGKEATKLGDFLGNKMAEKYGVEFDPVTGQFIGENAALANKMNKMNIARYKYYTQKEKERVANEKAMAEREAARQADIQRIQSNLDRGGYDSTSSIPDRDRRNVTEASAAASKGVGGGGYTASDSKRDAARGRYMMGGLADLVDIYD